MIDTKVVPAKSPSGAARFRVVVIRDNCESTFMLFWPQEMALAQECACNLREITDDPDHYRLYWSERRFEAEPLHQGAPRGKRHQKRLFEVPHA